MKYRCKYGDFVGFYGVILLYEAVFLCFEIIFISIALFAGDGLLEAILWIPWWIQTTLVCILAALYLIYLIGYLCTKSNCTIDENEIVFSDKKGETGIAKEEVQLIYQVKLPIFLMLFNESPEGYCQTTFLKNNRETEGFSLLPRNIKRMKKLGYPIAYVRFPFHTVTKEHILYFVGEEMILIELFRVNKVTLNYSGYGVGIEIDFQRGDGNFHHDILRGGFREAEGFLKKLQKEKLELNFFSYPATGRIARRHLEILFKNGFITKEQYDLYKSLFSHGN